MYDRDHLEPSPGSLVLLDQHWEGALADLRPPGAALGIVAFSGGPDSTALLLAAVRYARRRCQPPPLAVHIDHAADDDSRRRAHHAAYLARRIGAPFLLHRLPAALQHSTGLGPEAAARSARYNFLARVATAHGTRWVATGHHRDDQAETVLLRWSAGSGLRGLAAIPPRRSLVTSGSLTTRTWLLRPFLHLSREVLRGALEEAGLAPNRDPTNHDLSTPRNLCRHQLLPLLENQARSAGEPPLAPRLAALAERVRRVRKILDPGLADHLELRSASPRTASLRTSTLKRLPEPLWPWSLALLHRAGGAGYPPGRDAVAELRRQLQRGNAASGAGCDAGDGWRWETGPGDRLTLISDSKGPVTTADRTAIAPAGSLQHGFSYILEVPGEVLLGGSGLRLRMYRTPLADWMFQGSETRAGLNLALRPGGTVRIRGRRPGDRLRPLGGPGSRRLKDILIDARVPHGHRDSLPLLEIDGRITWVPGVTIRHAARLPRTPPPGATVWVAEILPSPEAVPTLADPRALPDHVLRYRF